MDTQDLEVMATELLQSFENGELERHEVHERLRQTLDQMRAFGMPLPEDLVALEEELAREFVGEAGDIDMEGDGEGDGD
ncbi:MAG: hypothetical protein HQL36_05825 [Alphaproteobacteria bacterium]|nr:hypothetical protein [Alphaproteobacteria bacterium]MBF0250288.1 hypothetical protein [Alphaproteobacteria bacterium]